MTLNNGFYGNLIGVDIGSSGWILGELVGTAAEPLDAKLNVLALNEPGLTQTLALLEGSPAFDAVACLADVATGQRGSIRPQGSVCDIGAFEYYYVDTIRQV